MLDHEVIGAHQLMTRLLVSTRLLAPDLQAPPAASARALARACQQESLDDLLHALTKARHGIATAWHKAFDSELEIET